MESNNLYPAISLLVSQTSIILLYSPGKNKNYLLLLIHIKAVCERLTRFIGGTF